MKKLLVAFMLLFTGLSGWAQQGNLDEKWLGYMVETERRAIFQEGMILTDANRDAFWALYDEYEDNLAIIRKQDLGSLKRYASEYENMTDEQAIEITKELQNTAMQRIFLQKKYSKKMAKEVGGKVAARFAQIDNAVSMLMRLQIMDEIPMVGDFN
jgi:hypothetical protein